MESLIFVNIIPHLLLYETRIIPSKALALSVRYSKGCFLVGAFSLKEKSPTLTVSSFFCFFQLTISL